MNAEYKRRLRAQADADAHMPRYNQVMVPTSEDWAPSLERDGSSRKVRDGGGFVSVTFYADRVQVSVWGADDTSMVRHFATEDQARRAYCNLPSVITFDGLRLLGFRFD